MDQRLRVLLGDPPADCQTSQHDPAPYSGRNARDAHYAAVVEQHVLYRQQRALLIAGAGHFARVSDARPVEGNVTQRLEQRYPGTIFVVAPHVIFEETLATQLEAANALERCLAVWPVPALALVRDTWLGEVDGYLHFDDIAQVIEPDGRTRLVRVPYVTHQIRLNGLFLLLRPGEFI